MPSLARNKRAFHDYDLLEKVEAGIELFGAEVKSAKAGQVSLKGAYVAVRGGEAWLLGAHVSAYKPAGTSKSYDPTRTRRLLLKKSELQTLIGKTKSGLTIVPLSLYTKRGLVKLEIALARGRKQYEKRDAIRKREVQREIKRTFNI